MATSFRLKQVLEEKGMSQMELMRRTGVSQARISEIYSGKAKAVSLSVLDKFASALNVSVHALIEESPSKRRK